MEEIKVCDLASEFALKNSMVISELKKIGVWVPSSETPLDQDIASRIRRRLQLMVDNEQEEQAKAEKAKEKKTTTRGRRVVKKTIRQLGKPRKAQKKRKEEPEEEQPAIASPLSQSMKPRKGKASYRGITEDEEPAEEKVEEVSIYDEPLIEKVEAHASPETIEALSASVVEAPVPEEEKQPEAAPSEPAGEVAPAEGAPTEEKEKDKAAAPKKAAKAKPKLAPPPRKLKIISRPKPKKVEPSKPAEAAKVAQPAAQREAVKPRTRGKKPVERPEEVTLPETVTVKELSEKIQVKSKEVLRELLQRGVVATINHSLDQATAEVICESFGVVPNFVSFEESVIEVETTPDEPEKLGPRAPVVTVMGHVDHGKTSLLDAIRKTNVAEGEAGGITQHIGAYHVDVGGGKRVVFVDTPGHEAFTLMRSRGAQVTDIVVLVVAADDGVMPQTREAIDHARAAGVPILVAINKMDKPGADAQRVKQQLTEHGLVAEDWGGDTVMVEVSAIKRTNLDQLLEMILLVAEMQELTANPDRLGSGIVLEARLDKGRGAVATILVQNGTVSVGDPFIAGTCLGKIRAMFNDRGEKVDKIGPSSAVEILGFQGLPEAGDPFQVVEDASKARQIADYRTEQARESTVSPAARVSLDDFYAQLEEGEVKELPIVLKADAQGSVEVLKDTLNKLSTDKVKIKILMSAVGAITETDVLFASASEAIVIGFNVRPEQNANSVAEREGVEIRLYTVIYDIASDIEQAMVGLLEPTVRETYQGRAEVRQIFKVPRYGTIAGCYVQDGQITRNSEVRLLRDNVVVYEGKLDSLRRFKDDVNQVKSGYECGLSIANYGDVKPGDVIEAFIKEEVKPEL